MDKLKCETTRKCLYDTTRGFDSSDFFITSCDSYEMIIDNVSSNSFSVIIEFIKSNLYDNYFTLNIRRYNGDCFNYKYFIDDISKYLDKEFNNDMPPPPPKLLRQNSIQINNIYSNKCYCDNCSEKLTIRVRNEEDEKKNAMKYLLRVADSLKNGGVTDIGDTVIKLCQNEKALCDLYEYRDMEGNLLSEMIHQSHIKDSPWLKHMKIAFKRIYYHNIYDMETYNVSDGDEYDKCISHKLMSLEGVTDSIIELQVG
jgi:hypothetical protein